MVSCLVVWRFVNEFAKVTKRKVLESWKKEMGEWLQLGVLHSIHTLGNSISQMCSKVQTKVYRHVLMQLRGEKAQFHIAPGQWRQISRDLQICRECSSGDIEDVRHWLLQCST